MRVESSDWLHWRGAAVKGRSTAQRGLPVWRSIACHKRCQVPLGVYTAKMPSTDEGEHAPSLGLPPDLQGDSPLWVIRFTGEVFAEYE